MTLPSSPTAPRAAIHPDHKPLPLAGRPDRSAAWVLFDRHRAALERLARWWARRHGIPAGDRAEACQEAALAFLQGAEHYDAYREQVVPTCVPAFLRKVVRDHLNNWARQRQRRESHLDRAADWVESLDQQVTRRPVGLLPYPARGPSTSDPAHLVERLETLARCAEVIQHFSEEECWLWEQLLAGRRLRVLAGEAGLSYKQAQRVRRHLLVRLRQVLKRANLFQPVFGNFALVWPHHIARGHALLAKGAVGLRAGMMD